MVYRKRKYKERTVILPDWRTAGDRQASWFFGDFETLDPSQIKIPFLKIENAHTYRNQKPTLLRGHLDKEGYVVFDGKRYLPENEEQRMEWATGMCFALCFRTEHDQATFSGTRREWNSERIKADPRFKAMSDLIRESTIPQVDVTFSTHYFDNKGAYFREWK